MDNKVNRVDSAGNQKSYMLTRDMTTLDELTHDFANQQGFREHCLSTYGQYFSHDNKRIVRRPSNV